MFILLPKLLVPQVPSLTDSEDLLVRIMLFFLNIINQSIVTRYKFSSALGPVSRIDLFSPSKPFFTHMYRNKR